MLKERLEQVKEQQPLIHAITNYVTVNDCANVLLACGASPIMADDEEEVAEITAICGGLTLNIGTLNKRTIPAMKKAGRKANELGHPVVLDPVGAGASTLRTRTALELLDQISFSVIRGNISEIKTLSQGDGTTHGVDAAVEDEITEDNLLQAVTFAKAFAKKTGAVIAITGAIDIVADENRAYAIFNGNPLMRKVTGTGCQLSVLIAAFVAANQEKRLEAVLAAVCMMGVAGEKAFERLQAFEGNASYRDYIIDAICKMEADELEKRAKFQCVEELMERKTMRLYAVTDRAWVGRQTLVEQVEQALKGGASCIQLREKELDEAAFLKEAIEMKQICEQYKVPLIINDNVEIALKSGADGVHIGQQDMDAYEVRKKIGANRILGVSTKTVEQAIAAKEAGADYLGVGAVFPTTTKKDASVVSLETVKQICNAVDLPVVAIGGITKSNIRMLSGTGVDGVALVSAIFAAKDIEAECQELALLSEKMVMKKSNIKAVLTIAGSDSSGGAGIQADIKTMMMQGVYAMSAITALTAQNTKDVRGIFEVSPEFLQQQMDAVFEDIRPDAIKIGMVASKALIEKIAERLHIFHAEHIVVDPVMVATSGSRLIKEEAIVALKERLLPLAELVTPNIPEAEILSNMPIGTEADMVLAAKKIWEKYGCAVLLKGGHSVSDANDLLYTKDGAKWFYGKRIHNPNTHGTGCTLSSAIASNLAKGDRVEIAVEKAKEYISGALAAMLNLGEGSGPMNHAFRLQIEEKKEGK
ncbi:MAG: hydroxymethylpyrimidine/phosphomethylpyrimidine kinase [Clostridiales bacterium]|nr:hydroxymethylpyrimidine/phosphomethylpyrimidine kinase [Clostridiales bacterium]